MALRQALPLMLLALATLPIAEAKHSRRRRSTPAPPPPSGACECPGATAGTCAPGWHTFDSGASTCIEQDVTTANQNCSRACAGFGLGVPWEPAATRQPAATVPTATAESWAWVGSHDHHAGGEASLKGALEFLTGDHTHCTMVYFEAGGGNITTGSLAVAEARRWVALPAQRSWLGSAIPVRQALRYMWGCGPSCKSTSALIDVDSQLARLKYG